MSSVILPYVPSFQLLLTAGMSADGINLAADEGEGLFSLAQFDPVHSLRERTNEVWLAVSI